MSHGLAYVSEDRIGQSLVMDFAIRANASLTVLDQATRAGMLSSEREIALAAPHLDRLRLKFSSYEQPVGALSGGNQQKVVLAKWLSTGPQLLILDEPTQGIDVQSKADVHAMIADLAQPGHGDHPDHFGDARTSRHVRPHDGVAGRPSTAEFCRSGGDAGKVMRAATGPASRAAAAAA